MTFCWKLDNKSLANNFARAIAVGIFLLIYHLNSVFFYSRSRQDWLNCDSTIPKTDFLL
ncbi:MAG: hypothetical protein ACTMUB_01860 [cyanobacterium endosymbiont of Rhopalodia musculus]